MKTKGQQPQVVKLELLALLFRGGVAERPIAIGCKPIDGATIQRLESLRCR